MTNKKQHKLPGDQVTTKGIVVNRRKGRRLLFHEEAEAEANFELSKPALETTDVNNEEQTSSIDLFNEPAVSYGAPNTNSQYYLINQIQHGISYSSFQNLQKQSPFTVADWSSYLHLTDRTLLRYKTENKIFENIYAEKILELTKLIKKGIDTFSSKNNFSQWLNTVSVSLGGYRPKDLLVTSVGINIVFNELIRIDYGVLA